jgi:hypothetical protein
LHGVVCKGRFPPRGQANSPWVGAQPQLHITVRL